MQPAVKVMGIINISNQEQCSSMASVIRQNLSPILIAEMHTSRTAARDLERPLRMMMDLQRKHCGSVFRHRKWFRGGCVCT